MAYHMLYTYEESATAWFPQFGDHDKEDVMSEREGWLDSPRAGCFGAYPAAYLKVVKFPRVPTQRQVNERAKLIPQPK